MPFPIVVYRIANERGNASWIRWSPAEDVLEIANTLGEFSELRQALAGYRFGQGSASSVKKNFAEYQFDKLDDGRQRASDENGVVWIRWSHPSFHKGNPELVGTMRRKPSKRKTKPKGSNGN
ncbi:hypothetical protein GGH94_005400 [Coemansia aciculifera]|uniref:HSF-type DNA-binding domain-containing protein n=1 Tax=Coemansia aciculifera TaxID=417176 RepID=A0A9W8M1C4_9FUNG|nr:hypothetical protein GGH94_005400 [Coemansia aciculifera]